MSDLAAFQALPLVLLGAGGHAKVVLSLVRAAGLALHGVCDPALARQGVAQWRGLPVLGGDEALDALAPSAVALANGIGQLAQGTLRRDVYERLARRGFRFPALVHPQAWVDPSAVLADGVQVMAGAVVQADCRVGENTIVNTRASLDHDCLIGAHVHVAPGACLCGTVSVGDGAFVGAGATVLPNLTLGERAVVAAGATLARSLPADAHHLPHRSGPRAGHSQDNPQDLNR
ncbi:acetyltransferase [Azohydromonas lata]|uniref:Acetyltransferase n=1 Tax=Azohydromonas lata TaxID=45677 RepID=A0ABU5IBR3_9BURK|nr:acetyltransferase [Azohydromonas lata]MDZ5456535.1 acetyltransferase [Azohydromonas lata]